ncbi:phospho-N-acetylmuramoyl-pentapeptide-transferase, partial [Chloroflexota bacterium]
MKPTSLVLALAGLSFIMTVIWGGPLLRILRHFKMGKLIRIEEPARHFTKMGTPTMGGIMVILPVAMLTILLNAVSLFGLN